MRGSGEYIAIVGIWLFGFMILIYTGLFDTLTRLGLCGGILLFTVAPIVVGSLVTLLIWLAWQGICLIKKAADKLHD